jgi:hypothetical protein
MEQIDEAVGGVGDVAGRLHEPLFVLVGRGRLHDPIGEESVTRELVEPPAGLPDAPPDRGDEPVHDHREALEPDGFLHERRGFTDVGGHDEHLDRLAVDHGVEQLVAPEALFPVGWRVGLQQAAGTFAIPLAFGAR